MAFPSSPTNNQTAVVNGISYIYNSTKGTWKRVSSAINGEDAYARSTANAAFLQANTATSYAQSAGSYANSAFTTANNALPKTGGTINGNLTVTGTVNFTANVTSTTVSGNTGQFFGYASNGFNALYAGIPTGYVTVPNEVAQFTGSNNSYVQINFQNLNGGGDATTDWIATANNGTDSTYYVDLGIAGSGYDPLSPSNSLGTSIYPNDAYLYAQGNTAGQPGGNLTIGTTTSGTVLRVIAGGVNTQNTVTVFTGSSVNYSVPVTFADNSSQNSAGFTSISANGVSITPTSNNTFYFAAGNNITISACNTTKIITIASTASGGGSGSGTITFNVAPPATGNTIGDRWIDSNDGTEYTYVSDGTSTQWIDLTTPAFNLNNLIGGTTGSIPWQSAANTTSFLNIGTTNQVLTSNGTQPVWITPVQTSIYANTGQLNANAATGAVQIGLAASGVTAASYGSSAYIPGLTIDVYGRITSANNIAVSIPDATSNVQYYSFGVGTSGSGTQGEIRATNAITSYYSDDRLKTRLNNINDPLEKLLSLNGFYYEANEVAQKLGYECKKEVGVSAQEVQKVLPEIVVSAPIDDKYLTVHYEKLIPLLIEAMKEQQKQIEELKSIINGNN